MKASFYTRYGSPERLELKEISKPIPTDNEILVRVHATTVNRTDCAMLRAKPFIMRFFTGLFKPSNPILGTDFSGIIESVGRNVSKFKVGEAIFGFNDAGISSHAEYLCLQENNNIATVPDTISFAQATASIEGSHLAQNFINKVNLKESHHVLVNGGTGAIGSALIQLLLAKKIHVTATCDTSRISLIKNLGVSNVIDYTQDDFTHSKLKFDFVFDAVGKSSFGKCKQILKKNGIYISSEPGWMAENLFYALITPLFGGKKVVFPFPNKTQESVDLVKKLMLEGKFTPLIDRTFSLDTIKKAFIYVEKGEKTGNVVISLK